MSFLSRMFTGERVSREDSAGMEQRTSLYNMPLIPSNLDGHMADSGEAVSERTALQLTAVYACVRILADTVASLPMSVYRKSAHGDGDTFRRDEVLPTPAVIASPWPDLSDFEFKFQMMTSLALRGNSYHYVAKFDRLERALELEPLHPDMVVVMYDYDTGQRTYSVNGEKVPNYRMLHIRRFSLPAALVGLSPIQQARQSIGLGLAADRYGARYFGDSANPSSVMETDQDLAPENVLNVQKQWIASHGGRRHPAVLSGGLKWKPISITPEESQFLETRQYQISDIAMLYGVPLHMLQHTERSTSWGCLPADALVFTTSGPVPIVDVKVGDQVWSFTGDGMAPAPVTGWQMTGHKPLLTIRTHGRELRLTANHRVPVHRDGAVVEVCAGQIRVGDHLLVPHGLTPGDRSSASDGRVLWPAEMFRLGARAAGRVPGWVFGLRRELQQEYLLGFFSATGRRQVCTSPEKDLLEDVRHLCIEAGIGVGTLTVSDAGFAMAFPDDTAPPLCPGVVLHEVTGIETGKCEVPVYDIEVAGLAHFVSDGVIVHNTGIEQISIGFVTYTLRSWLGCIEAAMTRLLPPDQFARFHVDALLRGDQQARYNAYTQARNAGWMSVNEIRAKEDLAPIANGDGYLQPLNYGPLGAGPAEGSDEGDN